MNTQTNITTDTIPEAFEDSLCELLDRVADEHQGDTLAEIQAALADAEREFWAGHGLRIEDV